MIKNFREIIKKELNGDMGICFRIDSYHLNEDGNYNRNNKIIKLVKSSQRSINNSQETVDSEQQYILCSFITKTMVEYDNFIIRKITDANSRNHKNSEITKFIKNNRPYFCSFSITDSDSIKMFLKAYKLNNKIHFAKIVKSNEKGKDLGINLIYGLSPVTMSGRKLLITDKNDKYFTLKANALYKAETKTIKKCIVNNVDKEINNSIRNHKITGVDVYRVGNGNCNFIDFADSNDNGILYDIGYNCKSIPTKEFKNCKYPNSTKALRKLTPSCVIISHWDMDHYIGCAYANDKIFKVKWIAPRYEIEKSFNSLRLGVYLAKLNNLVLLDNNFKGFNNNNLLLCVGSGKDSKVSERNRKGIYLYINKGGKIHNNILLTGDVPYNCFDNDILRKTSFLVAPHHGADMNYNKTYMQLIKFFKGECKNRIAIISCNDKAGNRPSKDHVEYLETMGFKVITTENGSYRNPKKNKPMPNSSHFHYDITNSKKTKFE